MRQGVTILSQTRSSHLPQGLPALLPVRQYAIFPRAAASDTIDLSPYVGGHHVVILSTDLSRYSPVG
jgi:hypothetical protein